MGLRFTTTKKRGKRIKLISKYVNITSHPSHSGSALISPRLNIRSFLCVGRGGAAAPNRLLGEGCLSGASSLAILFGAEAEGPPWGRARAEMVLVPFAETKGTRLQGRNPASNNSWNSLRLRVGQCGHSAVFIFAGGDEFVFL